VLVLVRGEAKMEEEFTEREKKFMRLALEEVSEKGF
jgi:hypothetical protein